MSLYQGGYHLCLENSQSLRLQLLGFSQLSTSSDKSTPTCSLKTLGSHVLMPQLSQPGFRLGPCWPTLD